MKLELKIKKNCEYSQQDENVIGDIGFDCLVNLDQKSKERITGWNVPCTICFLKLLMTYTQHDLYLMSNLGQWTLPSLILSFLGTNRIVIDSIFGRQCILQRSFVAAVYSHVFFLLCIIWGYVHTACSKFTDSKFVFLHGFIEYGSSKARQIELYKKSSG